MRRFTVDVLTLVLLALFAAAGCRKAEDKPTVVLYTSVDEPFARPILAEFESRYHVSVVLKTDAEATKTVGLAERIRAEKDNPRCDVYWGNEPFHTIALADEGLLTGYECAPMKEIPPTYKDAGFRWASIGLRARVLAVSASVKESPKGLQDLLNPAYKGKVAMATPTFGTTGGHVAALYALWGQEKADAYFRALRDNGVKLVGGNSVVAQMVGSGSMLVGLTDNDDVEAAKADGGSLSAVLPDQDSTGTLTVSTTIGLVTGAPHRPAAEQLISYLLSKEVEDKLIAAHFAAWSVRDTSTAGVRPMSVDYPAIARLLPSAIPRATAILEGRP